MANCTLTVERYRERVYGLVIAEGFERGHIEAWDCPPDADQPLTSRCFAEGVHVEDAAFELLLQYDPFYEDVDKSGFDRIDEAGEVRGRFNDDFRRMAA
jgi:hypothetical protein